MTLDDNIPKEQSTSQRVKRSMLSMLIGRPISALGGLLVLVLLSRLLTKEEYGAYFALWALVEITILLSDPGVLHLIYRFVSASSNIQGQIMPKGPARQLLFTRCIALAIGAGILLIIPAHWLDLFKLTSSPDLLKAAAIILLFEGAARTIEAIFDTMLCQGASQISTVARTLIRLLGVYFCFLQTNTLTFEMLIWVDICATALGFLLASILLMRIYINRKTYEGHYVDPAPVPPRTLFYYAGPAYLSQILGILFSIDMLKLTLSGGNSIYELAVFGFVFSLTLVIQRYLPANLFAGIFRPLFVSAAMKEHSERTLVELLIACIKINWILIIPLAGFGFILGDLLLSKISGGNYQHAGAVLTASIVGLMGFSAHLILANLCLAKKTPWPLLGANLFATSGLLIGIYLGAKYGALGAAFAFGVNEALWCVACFYLIFRRSAFLPYADLTGLVRLLIIGLVTLAIAWLLKTFLSINPLIVASLLTVPFLIALCRWGIFSVREGEWLMAVLPLGHKLPLVIKFRSSQLLPE
ncbi:MAG TPA: oligosaccharide flippase family protein [Cellvibrionaceae bacterium]